MCHFHLWVCVCNFPAFSQTYLFLRHGSVVTKRRKNSTHPFFSIIIKYPWLETFRCLQTSALTHSVIVLRCCYVFFLRSLCVKYFHSGSNSIVCEYVLFLRIYVFCALNDTFQYPFRSINGNRTNLSILSLFQRMSNEKMQLFSHEINFNLSMYIVQISNHQDKHTHNVNSLCLFFLFYFHRELNAFHLLRNSNLLTRVVSLMAMFIGYARAVCRCSAAFFVILTVIWLIGVEYIIMMMKGGCSLACYYATWRALTFYLEISAVNQSNYRTISTFRISIVTFP